MAEQKAAWGEWMSGWKGAEDTDGEAARIDRQKAAFGADTLAKLKDINVLIVGLRGTGVETAKNLILSNVGGVTVWDPEPTVIRDLGSNFYLSEKHAHEGTLRAEAALPQLKSLNPYCQVEANVDATVSDELILTKDVNGTGKPFTAVVVTRLLPKAELFRINQTARNNNMAFIMAITSGVTASIFSDFGPKHTITDKDGEPLDTKALKNIEVLEKPFCFKVGGVKDGETIVVLTTDSNHGLDDGSVIELDDMNGALAPFGGRRFTVKRMAITVYDPKRQFSMADQILSNPNVYLGTTLQKMLDTNKEEFVAAGNDAARFNGKCRTLTLLDRLVLTEVKEEENAIFAKYEFGGLVNATKEVLEVSYAPLEETFAKTKSANMSQGREFRHPQMLSANAGRDGRGIEIHLQWAAALDFEEKNGRWPGRADGAAFAEAVQAVSDRNKAADSKESPTIWLQNSEEPDWVNTFDLQWPGTDRKANKETVERFGSLYGTELTGFCAYLGGAAAQEVIKKTGKFTPINQWIHHEDHYLITDNAKSNTGPPQNSRYDDQIRILGKEFHARAANANVFLVGCGALGCEYLKGLAMLGVATGRGQVTVTDMDTIETSNLSRQFLFRSSDVGNSKSTSGARVVKEWNPNMNVVGIEKFVGPSTENFFTDDFWEDLDLCWNALDNVKARQYTDGRCLWYSKPLLESGTRGTSTNSETILPFRTSTYNDGEDPPEVGIAMCTLRSFPYMPLHCIEFAKQALFQENFEFGPGQYEQFRSDKAGFFASLNDMSSDSERMDAMRYVKSMVDIQKGGKGVDFATCIQVAFEQMEAVFRTRILEVIQAGDVAEKESGKPYWTGTKRKPRAVEFSAEDALPMEYLYTTANMYAFVFGVDHVRNRDAFEKQVRDMDLKSAAWGGAAGKGVEEKEGEEEIIDPNDMDALKQELNAVDSATLVKATPHDFEKDDDSNFHIDYLTASTNLRSWNYNIRLSARHQVKVTAGRIIPALATTTAMICGLVDNEFCKLVMGMQNIGNERFYNANINLAVGSDSFSVFHPNYPEPGTNLKKTNLTGKGAEYDYFTTWDKLEYDGDLTGGELADVLEEHLGVKVVSFVGETNYKPAKSIKLWSREEKDASKLSTLFTTKLKSGCDEADRPAAVKKRVKGELKKLQGALPTNVVSVNTKAGDEYTFQVKMNGPAGSAYEGGLFLIEINLPLKYPQSPPKLSFVTSIKHCNIKDGVPCPNLLYGQWSPNMSVASVLSQLDQLLKEQQKGDALVPELAAMDNDAFVALVKEDMKKNAGADQEFAKEVAEVVEKKEKKEGMDWPHNYLILRGEFENSEGGEADLPRILLRFKPRVHCDNRGLGDKPAVAAAAAPAAAGVPVDAELAEKIKGMGLELDEPLEVLDCFKISAERAAILAQAAEGLTADNGVAVVAKYMGETIETIVKVGSDGSLEQCLFEDKITYDEAPIASLVEAKFTADGPWILSRGSLESVRSEQKTLFADYEKRISERNPECLSTLRSLLQAGPKTCLYTGGGQPHLGIPSHEGFSLRMPAEDVKEHTMLNDKGKVVDLPREACCARVWNPTTRSYDEVDVSLAGAPKGDAEAEKWFVGVVQKLKNSPYLGSAMLNALAQSKETLSMEKLGLGDFKGAFGGEFNNKWVDLVVKTE